MLIRRINLAVIATVASISVIAPELAKSVQLSDGTVSFVQQPRLVETATTIQDINAWGATYYFTINVPQNASEPLQTVTFNQSEGVSNIRFDLEDTRAFEGTRRRRGEKIALSSATRDREKRTVTVVFDPPVAPGKTITIGLRPVQNPFSSGVYLFGVKAFPAGAKTAGQFMGYGRLQFYGNSFD